MPIHEYVLPDGRRIERLFLHGEQIPEDIEVEVYDSSVDDYAVEIAHKTVSRAVVKFSGSFSGGTSSRDLVHKDDGSIVEPGRDADVKRARAEINKKNEQHRKDFVAGELATYDI